MCYYLYENIYTVTADTFNDEFIYWVEKSMKEPAAAKLIEQLKKANVPLKMLILQLMSAVDYYNSEELSKLSQTLDEIEHQNPIEAAKLQADNLVPGQAVNGGFALEFAHPPGVHPGILSLVADLNRIRDGLDDGLRNDAVLDRKSTRLNSSHSRASRMPSSA